MNDDAFRGLLVLLMCDDPTRLAPEQRMALEAWANRHAASLPLAYNDWIEAYHYH